ncbi:uncharacterized protein LOC121383870 [Gigantopelta aegis]|uniref:uncharacterized protein LOC121383870 n=1 Tax=Gigantopelta aegis TaxID=1735272 RepID=UPI001B88A209|nr:uncharacterized protein LOC121383870 [Gigantopelta aegis]
MPKLDSYRKVERSISLPCEFCGVTLPVKSASCETSDVYKDTSMQQKLDCVDFIIPKKVKFRSKKKTKINLGLTSTHMVETKTNVELCDQKSEIQPESNSEKPSDKTSEQTEKEETKKKKKNKKWRNVDPAEMGFKMTLFPRVPTSSTSMDEDEIHAILEQIDLDYLKIEERIFPFRQVEKYEGNNISDKYLRVDRHRKIRKAHNQVKDKYCRNVKNNDGRQKLYVHHRVIKLARLAAKRQYLHYPSPKTVSVVDTPSLINGRKATASRARGAPAQDLCHALWNDNVPTDIPLELASLLITLQHRDLTPEDYDTLLRLDDAVAVKTVPVSKLQSFRTDVVDDGCAGDICSVCLDPYLLGQTRKFLPCGHCFHANCIDMWLRNSSMNCPLDGLALDD